MAFIRSHSTIHKIRRQLAGWLVGFPIKLCYNLGVLPKIGKYTVLTVFVLLFSFVASAQTLSRAVLSDLDLEEFPLVRAYLDVRDAQGFFISGLQSGAITILEDDTALSGQLVESRPGAQIVIAFNTGTAFAILDFQGNTRYHYVSQALENWMSTQAEAGVDDFSLVTSDGVLASHLSDPQEWLTAWQAFDPALKTSIPTLDVLSVALDVATDPIPKQGMGRAVLFLTPSLTPDLDLVIQSLAARALQSNVRVHVGFIDSPAVFDGTSANQLRGLAAETGGQFFAFSNTELFPDFQLMFEYARRVYQLTYRSHINTAGTHNLSLVVNTDQGEILSEVIGFEMQLRPPNPIFIAPPIQIVRAIPDDADITVENLEPREYPIEIVVDFPDTIRRGISRTVLFANDRIVAENTASPFEYFTLDLTTFDASEQIVLRVEAMDELGLVGRSIDTPIQITVQRPQQGLLPTLARNATVIAIGIVGLAGGVLLLVLVIAGRIRPRRIGERRKKRVHYEDPVTQPVSQHGGQTELVKNVFARFTGRLPTRKLRLPQPARAKQEPFAYLVRVSEEGETDTASIVQIARPEVTFGSDASKAVVALEDPAVEPLHARLWHDDEGGFYIADQDSVAGTWLNFAPVSKVGSKVEHGDLIHVAKVGFRFTLSKPTNSRRPIVVREEEEL